MTDPTSSFEAYFDLVFPQAEKVARRITGSSAAAEDIAAESLARAYANWSRVRRHPSPEAWALRTSINLSVDRARRRGHAQNYESSLGAEVGSSEDAADQIAIRVALTAALHQLPKRQRHVVALRYLADMSEAQVADLLGISAGSVKTHLHRALKKLRVDLSLKESHANLT